MKKQYYTMNNIGRCKYSVNFHDGIRTHKDGSPFFGIALFNNKKKVAAFIKKLESEGYTEA